jgi:hypothetical protein
MTMIVVYGKIFDSLRKQINLLEIEWLNHMIRCTMCMGMWIGMFLSICMDTDFGLLIGGFVSSGTSYLLSKIVSDEGIVVDLKKD